MAQNTSFVHSHGSSPKHVEVLSSKVWQCRSVKKGDDEVTAGVVFVGYPLVNFYSLLLKMAMYIVDDYHDYP